MTNCALHIRSYGAELPLERHEFIQFVLPLSGRLELDIDGRGNVIGNGMAAIVPKAVKHTQRQFSPHQALIVDLPESMASSLGIDRLGDSFYFNQSSPSQQFTRLLAQTTAGVPSIDVERIGQALVCSISRDYCLDVAFLGLNQLIAANPFVQFSIAEMALACGLGHSQFHEAFQRAHGMSPHQWLLEHKLNAVKLALEFGELSLSDLAQRAGYSDQSALSRAFKQQFGVTMSVYRKRFHS